MSESNLQRAQKALRISDVFLRSATMGVAESYEHRAELGEELQSQLRHLVEKSEILVEEEDSESKKYFRVHIILGFRWGRSLDVKPRDDQGETDDDFIELGRIEGVYVAEYQLTDDLPQDCLDAFALNNASYHVWPYWREFVSNSCARMNVPKLMVPTMLLAQNRATDNRKSEQSE